MAQTHEQIVDMVILQWSRENRGRLFKNHNGQAFVGQKISDYFNIDIRFMKIKYASKITYGLGIGTSDLVGWENINGVPVFCSVEVKTKKYSIVSEKQKDWLNNLVTIGGRAYVAQENNNGYDLTEWRLE